MVYGLKSGQSEVVKFACLFLLYVLQYRNKTRATRILHKFELHDSFFKFQTS